MRATAELRREHAIILGQASVLSGLATSRMTRDVALQSRAQIMGLDKLLVDHLSHEDDHLYPALAASEDLHVRSKAEDCFADMGGILGAWIAYRDQWSNENIASTPERFRAATEGVIGALAIRVEMENRDLYPLMDRLERAPSSSQSNGTPRRASA